MGVDKMHTLLLGLGKEPIVQAKKPILLDYFCKNNVFITDIALSSHLAIAVSGNFLKNLIIFINFNCFIYI